MKKAASAEQNQASTCRKTTVQEVNGESNVTSVSLSINDNHL